MKRVIAVKPREKKSKQSVNTDSLNCPIGQINESIIDVRSQKKVKKGVKKVVKKGGNVEGRDVEGNVGRDIEGRDIEGRDIEGRDVEGNVEGNVEGRDVVVGNGDIRSRVFQFISRYKSFIPPHLHPLLFHIPEHLLFNSNFIHFHIFAFWFLSRFHFHFPPDLYPFFIHFQHFHFFPLLFIIY